MIRTVVELDLVGYSTIAVTLEDCLGVGTSPQLNQQIQDFVDIGLKAAKRDRAATVMKTTGDGAILVFDKPSPAHTFAAAVHAATQKHNHARGPGLGKRVFRIGIATGEVVTEAKAGGGFDSSGVTVIRAVRLEAAGKPGEVLCDPATFEGLTAKQKPLYSAPETVTGKRAETFEARRWLANPQGPKDAEFFSGPTATPPALTKPVPLPPPIPLPARISNWRPEDGVAAVLRNDGVVVGMGILVGSRHLLTCAHVVNAGLGVGLEDQPRPGRSVGITFPFSRTDQRTTPTPCGVLARGWFPVHLSDKAPPEVHDVAVLELPRDAPADAGTAVLGGGEPIFKNEFTSFYTAAGDSKGASAHGTIGGRAKDDTFELRGVDFIGEFIGPGFSGGGCWDRAKALTVGMVVTAREDAPRVAHMTPARLLRRALSIAVVHVPPPPDEDQRHRQLREAVVECLRGSRRAVDILIGQLSGAANAGAGCDRLPHPKRCEWVVNALVDGPVAGAIDAMVLGYLAARKEKADGAAMKAIADVCLAIMPIIYRPADIRRVRAEVSAGGAMVVLPVTSPTSVEMIMAGVDGRPIEFAAGTDPAQSARGTLALHRPPEGGMDRGGERFVTAFRMFLAKKLLKPEHRKQSVSNITKSICTIIKKDIKYYGKRYYYFFNISHSDDKWDGRARVVDALKSEFPDIVFIGLEGADDGPDEAEIVHGLTALLQAVAKHQEKR